MKQLRCPIAKSALSYPHHRALETARYSWSYVELESKVEEMQLYLKTRSIPLKNLGIIAISHINTLILYFAAIREGYSVCLLNPKEPAASIKEKICALQLTLLSHLPSCYPLDTADVTTLIPEDHLSTYLYTSGSSATPKIACLSFKNHYYSALGILETLHLNTSSRYLLSLPLYHVAGLSIVFRTFLSGATLVISEDQETTTTYLLNHHISHLSLVLTQYVRLLQDNRSSLLSACLKAILLGGSSFPESLLQEGIHLRLPLYLSYGLTEMSSTVCCNPLMNTHNYHSSGHLLPYTTLEIDAIGELLVGGETLFQGYYSLATHQVIPHQGLFRTKDRAIYSQTEGLIVQGRADRLIISGGENIQPEEIERHLLSIPGISQAIIVAIPDREFGQKMIAVIDSHPNISLNFIPSLLAPSLPRYKIPKHYLPWPQHIRSASLKISAQLRTELYDYILSEQIL